MHTSTPHKGGTHQAGAETHLADLLELLGANIVSVDNEALVIPFQKAAELLIVLHSRQRILKHISKVECLYMIDYSMKISATFPVRGRSIVASYCTVHVDKD